MPLTTAGRPGAKLGGRPFSPELLLNRSEKVFTPNDFGIGRLAATRSPVIPPTA